MAEYDYKAVKRFIQMHSDVIESATLGMFEDWCWTAETVYENGRFNVDLDQEGLEIAYISGSSWATPSIEITYKDGRQEMKSCYTGEVGGNTPKALLLGCLSSPLQDEVEGKYGKSLPKLRN